MKNVLENTLKIIKLENMKKLVFLFGIMLSMIACSGNSTKTTNVNDSTNVDSSLIDTISIDSIDSIN